MVQGAVEYNLAFLRLLSWIEATGAKIGDSIHMELHEMGLDGRAVVAAIDACPDIEPDDGTGRNVVTGTMAHPGDNILYLGITGLDEPLGVTDTHPIWSETRQDFVVAGQLEVGEQFRTLTGESATLTKIHPHRGPPEMVFNLEVDGEHVYCVERLGLLVHNDCIDFADDFVQKNGGTPFSVVPSPYTSSIGNLPGYSPKNWPVHALVEKGGVFFDPQNPNGIAKNDWWQQYVAANGFDSVDEASLFACFFEGLDAAKNWRGQGSL